MSAKQPIVVKPLAENDPERDNPTDALFGFPCEFPIKVMGLRQDGFAQEIAAHIADLVPDLDHEKIEMRVSKQARYISLTLPVRAVSRAQLDAIYLKLTSHPWVKVVL